MKAIKYIILLAFSVALIIGCKKETNDDTAFASSINTPTKLKMLFDITQNNTGQVTITPYGESVAYFDIYFGDGGTTSTKVLSGNNVKHNYGEGTFTVKVVGHSVTGQMSEATQALTVSFKAPENLDFIPVVNKLKLDVTASALYETMFKIYFGDVPNEVPLVFLEGDVVSHTYTAAGSYNVKVVAVSGGAATAELIKVVKIAGTQIDVPATFDDPTVDYTVTDFEGAVTVDAFDPTNAANKVKKTTKPIGSGTSAGTTIGATSPRGFFSRVPLTVANSKMSVRVYSPAVGLKVRLKMEEHANAAKTVETDAYTTVANTWETLIFDFTVPTVPATAALNPAYLYDMGSIFFDFGKAGNDKFYYWDDVKYLGTVITPVNIILPLDFQLPASSYVFTDFAGGVVTIENNPAATGNNTSTKVAKMVKNAGQTYGGSFIALSNPINFAGSVNKQFKMKVYSPRVGAKVLLKVENLTNGGVSFEKEVATTVANAWETLTFDYSGIDISKSYQKVVLIFDNGTNGDGTANFTFYFDDITLN